MLGVEQEGRTILISDGVIITACEPESIFLIKANDFKKHSTQKLQSTHASLVFKPVRVLLDSFISSILFPQERTEAVQVVPSLLV